MAEFSLAFTHLLRARFPYIYVGTWEEERVLGLIREVARDAARVRTPRAVFTWSLTDGLVGPGAPPGEATESPMGALAAVERHVDSAIFVFKDFHVFFGSENREKDHQVVRKLRDLSVMFKQGAKPKCIVFLSPVVRLPVELEKEITVLDFDLPSVADLSTLFNGMIEGNKASGRVKVTLEEKDIESFANAALGLTLHEAENAFARAMVRDATLRPQDIDIIYEEKRQIVGKAGILEFVKSDVKIDEVGGLGNLKRWLKKRDKSWLDSAQKYNLPAPKGVLVTGIPGCGKSLLAKAIGAAWQLPLLRLDVGRIFGSYIGQSEENLRRALRTAEAVSPSILWIDEIEKGFSNSEEGDGGTSNRVFASFLTWMQEKAKPVFVIATANNIERLPPELLRKGRFDEIFFVDLPTRQERLDIFRLHMGKRLKHPEVIGNLQVTPEALAKLADVTEGFIGAEIEQVVISALFDAYAESRSLQWTDFSRAVRSTVPLSVTQKERIEQIRRWANERAVSASVAEEGDKGMRGGRNLAF
ncbi:MAG TPA: AAA family ATPase [Burkholderiales bacterium]|nr:AAA family ATPase [Burkholderiales bacterium]